MARAPITREGYNQLQKEMDNLKKFVRPQVMKDIEEARAHGDLSENAEYHRCQRETGVHGEEDLRYRAATGNL